VTDTAILAVLLAAIAGIAAGRAWAAGRRRGELRDRPGFRSSTHYLQGLHHLAAGQAELAISELSKVAREAPEAVEVLQVLGDLLRQSGQVERALALRQQVLQRRDLTRAERAHALAAMGTDYRKSGFLDRALRTFQEVLETDPGNLQALSEIEKLQEEQRQWPEAYETRTRLARLRKTDDGLVLGHLQAEMGRGRWPPAAPTRRSARSAPRSRSTGACSPRTWAWPTCWRRATRRRRPRCWRTPCAPTPTAATSRSTGWSAASTRPASPRGSWTCAKG
jgi:tetratricopeptide (TPR) repeat protein